MSQYNKKVRQALLDACGQDVSALQFLERIMEGIRCDLPQRIEGHLAWLLLFYARSIELGVGGAHGAEKAMRCIVMGSEKLGQSDQAGGIRFRDIGREAVKLWGRAWARIPRDCCELAGLVFDGVTDNRHGVRDRMIHDFADALGPDGLLTLKKMVLEQYRATQFQPGLNTQQRRAPLLHLADIAEAMGDVDLYIQVQQDIGEARRSKEDSPVLPRARLLFEAGRFDEAWAYLQRIDADALLRCREEHQYRVLKGNILEALGRDPGSRDKLRCELWREPTPTALQRVLKFTPPEDREGLVKRMTEFVISASGASPVPFYLTECAEYECGEWLNQKRMKDFYDYGSLALFRFAELLQSEFPDCASRLYRAFVSVILDAKRETGYDHAAECLVVAEGLAQRSGRTAEHKQCLSLLRKKHRRKSEFWKRLRALRKSSPVQGT